MHKNLIPALLTILLVTGMTAAAELLGNQEILFPEIAAIAAGALLSPKLAWRTDALHMLLTVTLGAWAGIGIVRFVPLPLPAFLIPPESVARFPLEVLAGASILTGIAVLQARIRALAFQKE